MMAELIRDARFWMAVVLLVKSIVFYAAPDFPPEVWGAVDAVLAAVIGALAGDAAVRLTRARAAGMRNPITESTLLSDGRYLVDGQDVASLIGLVLLAVGLALYDVRYALLGVGGLLLIFALVGALLRVPEGD